VRRIAPEATAEVGFGFMPLVLRRVLKTLFTIHSYLDLSGGAALSTRELLELLAARGADCAALTAGVLDYERETTLHVLSSSFLSGSPIRGFRPTLQRDGSVRTDGNRCIAKGVRHGVRGSRMCLRDSGVHADFEAGSWNQRFCQGLGLRTGSRAGSVSGMRYKEIQRSRIPASVASVSRKRARHVSSAR
jgi:hypothetical protein